ncbi:zinc-dependent metalloprotease family protein [Microcoleus sp. herbarium7]|uniref:zinc-dependent metalloprotease family protein n=1 Tax=Microcoleus sp. herbarium7 TaxID=3055435 RepID=UPI002FD0E57F
MASVKAMLDCIGVDTSRSISVLGHFFGFLRRRVPTDPEPSATAAVSLLQQVREVQGQHIHLNVIRVGFDLIADADQDEAVERLDYAIYKTRNIYRQVNLGVGRVEHYFITSAEADNNDDLGDEDEAEELWENWSVDNNGIDVFVVRNISDDDFVGLSPISGRCTKGRKNDGLIGGEINRGFDEVARTFAHEIGHFLGLEHNHDSGEDCENCPDTIAGRDNLMAQTRCTNTTCGGNGVRNSTVLTNSQGNTMRDHCSVRDGCT